jgi:hypothetical protein
MSTIVGIRGLRVKKGSADVEVQNTFHARNNITCSKYCKYRTAASTMYLENRFVSGI